MRHPHDRCATAVLNMLEHERVLRSFTIYYD